MTIRELREKNKLTQVALAKSLGVSSNAISAIESGRLKLSERMASRIKEIYGEAVEQAADAGLEKAAAKVEKKARAARKRIKAAEEKMEAMVTAEAEKLAEDAAQAVLDTEKKAEKKERAVRSRAKADKPGMKAAAEAVTAPVAAVEKKAKKARKTVERKASKTKKTPKVVIQSPLGGEITEAEILARMGDVDTVYVRVDQNKAFWVKGEETGDINLW